MSMYKVYLVNFDICKYEGDNLDEAWHWAVKSGFECVVHEHNTPKWAYSPISGWRKIIA